MINLRGDVINVS